ncbi:glycoside hydrolase family 3 C-terminal domain-containing protein [Cellulophaga baltica]|uniref:beta-glucosidase n=1 Tax=Cellulophaga TaxID=104264 RepID=UPI001C07ABDB|nr:MULTISPECIES: glycoside hydrolase family 3 N-terminal domain-containing protein [Cellulophaga]MBU2997877.1 glycoside hydrolase family 3 C-terminal domain-containing protein [Cellulophaga baltica]MDO6769278.1 glycoside hydrolase family 3 N-terminal domain-containing protein [Cellulophaga sp. 1_MG-2023]
MFKPFTPPIAYKDAKKQAITIINQMTIDEKISMIGGYNWFYTKGFEKFNIPVMYLSDATQGVNIRPELPNQLEKSVAFPSPIALTSTWNTELSNEYAKSIGEECRAGDIAVLLGPGMNIYRISQNGRNFEYFGEDPYLAARMVENYVVGMQNTGTIATLKHFIANNTDYKRRTSQSIVDDRALREIYMPAFEAGVNAGAMAVMTSYNLVNGEYAGQSKDVITGLLREKLGFKWLVMSDWWSVWDSEKVIKSGLDLDMPGAPREDYPDYMNKDEFFLRFSAKKLLEEGKVEEKDIDRMVTNIVTTEIAMGLLERPVKDTSYFENFNNHIQVALQTARESMVLLKNNGVLPISKSKNSSILLTGEYADKIPCGGGAAEVKGYDNVTMFMALKEIYGDNVSYIESPDDQTIKNSDYVIYSTGTFDSEGWDKSFDFSDTINNEIKKIASLNKNTIVAVSSGSGMNMTEWNDDIAGLIYSWYPGQIGFKAFAEIVAGITNPSGKLPITIEKTFKDSPGYGYIPEGKELYTGWQEDHKIIDPIIDVKYDEGIFVGYRWYEKKAIEPLYTFGFGLSYTTYDYSNFKIEKDSIKVGASVNFKIDIENTGKMDGQEIVQVYVRDIESSVERPSKELKDFQKVQLNIGDKKTLNFTLNERDFAFWDIETESWKVEPGSFEILIGDASNNILANGVIEVIK